MSFGEHGRTRRDGRPTSKADKDELGCGGEGDGGDGGASAWFGGCVCKFVPGVGGEIVCVQVGKSARCRTSCVNIQPALRTHMSAGRGSIRDTYPSEDGGMEASQCGRGVRVVVDGRETFPGDGIRGVESVERGLPDAGLEAIEGGHVDAATATPDVEAVGVCVIDGGCADAGLGGVGERG